MDRKIFEFALGFEKEGTSFYLDLASGTDNPLSKTLFYTLARQEIDHAERIEKFYSGVFSGNVLDVSERNLVEKEVKSFFDQFKAKRIPAENNLDIYKNAMDLEKKGYAAYSKFYNESKDENEKVFLKFLMKEEKNHLDSISNVYSYLSGTSDWLEKEESKVWNWMNI